MKSRAILWVSLVAALSLTSGKAPLDLELPEIELNTEPRHPRVELLPVHLETKGPVSVSLGAYFYFMSSSSEPQRYAPGFSLRVEAHSSQAVSPSMFDSVAIRVDENMIRPAALCEMDWDPPADMSGPHFRRVGRRQNESWYVGNAELITRIANAQSGSVIVYSRQTQVEFQFTRQSKFNFWVFAKRTVPGFDSDAAWQ